MGSVSILFCEREKYYTVYEVAALTGLSIKDIHTTVRKGRIKEVKYRKKNEVREVIVPLSAMESLVGKNEKDDLVKK